MSEAAETQSYLDSLSDRESFSLLDSDGDDDDSRQEVSNLVGAEERQTGMFSSATASDGQATPRRCKTERGTTGAPEKREGKSDRKTAKQMTERKRRDRINALLSTVRTLILRLLHKNPKHHRKLEKADILELVVSYLKRELNKTRRTTESTQGYNPVGPTSQMEFNQQAEVNCSDFQKPSCASIKPQDLPIGQHHYHTYNLPSLHYQDPHQTSHSTFNLLPGKSFHESAFNRPAGTACTTRRPLGKLDNSERVNRVPDQFNGPIIHPLPNPNVAYEQFARFHFTMEQPIPSSNVPTLTYPSCWATVPGTGYRTDENGYHHPCITQTHSPLWRPYM
ncbi:Helix-loop-helix DNA-binding domain protein [Opisthorchis viverrini]|uniref:Helix-loop-helix DNA-binding domain protein n=1 Tax=Opisthorchis viverrini TaxID=6198 RepID=A0A1S8X0T1_OPIVI|nr:Helix-loop-helix DNA-binding domain protein [Opisthorchis viverrini]